MASKVGLLPQGVVTSKVGFVFVPALCSDKEPEMRGGVVQISVIFAQGNCKVFVS